MKNIQSESQQYIQIKGELEIILENVVTGKKQVFKQHNVITSLAKTSIAMALRGDTSNNRGTITYCAVGTNTVAPTAADTQLGAELFRKQVSVRSNSANEAVFQTFFTTSEANGTLREAGLFGYDASATPNSGTLFSKIAINRVKTSNDTLTFRWTITIG
ncbi:MAG TPA: hypothetical protein VD999_05820 [Vitreimonas sp.]|nr:hypothetical protein [Vitreimonas sp.]